MICPNCKKECVITEHNFGALYTCSFCQAVYFINFDGQPEFGEISDEVPVDDPSNALENNEELQLEPLPSFETSVAPATDLSTNPFSDNFTEVQFADASPEPEVLSLEVNPIMAKQTPVAPVVPVAEQNPSDSFTNIAQEISDFGNTDSQLASMNYDLVVSGIDNQQTKSLFKEAIEDSKFAWDAFEIMKSIKNGSVEITKMSPAKAYLLAKRLQFLDLEKKWKQNVLS